MSLNSQSRYVLQCAFGDKWPQAWIEWWKINPVTGRIDTFSHGWGRAGKASPPDDQEYAVYFSVGLMAPGKRRSNEAVTSVHVIVLDDVGTKIDRDFVDLFVPAQPSCIMQTSQGNFQYMWLCPEGMTVPQFRQIRKSITAIFGPSDCNSPSHLVRLPQGVNGKPGKSDHKVSRVS